MKAEIGNISQERILNLKIKRGGGFGFKKIKCMCQSMIVLVFSADIIKGPHIANIIF